MKPIEAYWASTNVLAILLLPISWVFCLLVWARRRAYQWGLIAVQRLPVPVIVVGNITVGGTGKTPLVIRLVEQLRQSGYRPGVVSRGYGGQSETWPQDVFPDSDPMMTGDEPVLIARRTGCPVCVGPDRPEAAKRLVEKSACDVIISDDGMQHYALHRDLEIAVLDGKRRLGNGFCLPAGPLREHRGRLKEAGLVVVNGAHSHGETSMTLVPGNLVNMADPEKTRSLDSFSGESVHALAGIGNPSRYFDTLRTAGLHLIEHAFPDHHRFSADELTFDDQLPVIMTEKDAVKCFSFARPQYWYLMVYAETDPLIIDRINRVLKEREN